MPIIKVYNNGSTSGTPPSMNNHQRAKRKEVTGWSAKSARNQKTFFYSVDINALTGFGISCTLTLKYCPPTSDDFHRLRINLIKRLRRSGLIRGHWLIEWQRRGVPHLHGCFYFDNKQALAEIINIWLDIAEPYGAGFRGQDAKPIYDAVGWLQYLAKHGARGVNHYQRSNDNRPAGWVKTGRLWGKVGEWPIREAMRFSVNREGYWAYRRLVRGWSIAQARESDSVYQLKYVRRMLSCNERNLSEVRGTSDWMPADVASQLVVWLGSQGHEVEQVFND